MGRFIIVFFCSILVIGNIETTNNEEYTWQMNNGGRGPILKEQMFLLQGYQNIQGVKNEQRNSPTESCLKHDKPPEPPIPSSPNRRSFSSQGQRYPWINFDPTNLPPQVLGYEDNNKFMNNEEAYSPQLFDNEDRVAESQYNLRESNPRSNEDSIEDSVIVLDVTSSLVNEKPPNQQIDQELKEQIKNKNSIGEPSKINSDVTEEQLDLTPTAVEPSLHQTKAGCAEKHDIDSSATPHRRILVPNPKNIIIYDSDMLTNKVVKMNSHPTHELNTNNIKIAHQLSEASNVNAKTVTKTRNLDANKNMNKIDQQNNEEGRASSSNYVYNDNNYNHLKDPAKGEGISYINKNTMKFLDYDRVCYACSSAYNPTCLSPDRKTTVKYCSKGVNACVTKTFGNGSTLTLIRDCGQTCNDAKIPGLVPNYKTCSICHTDLCNGSYSINVYSSILALPTIALVVLVKPLLGFG